MSIASDLRTVLTQFSGLTSLVSTRVSPYLRNRDDPFPGITFEIATEELNTDAAGTTTTSQAEGEITVHARTFTEAETIGAQVLAAIAADSSQGVIKHIRPVSVSRTYEDPYDGSSDLVYRWALTCQIKG
jgi:hypothetical protein